MEKVIKGVALLLMILLIIKIGYGLWRRYERDRFIEQIKNEHLITNPLKKQK